MRALSNFAVASHGSPGAVEYRPARPDELPDALALVLGIGGRPAGREQVADFITFANRRDVDLGRTWVARVGGGMIWALLPIVSPGRTMLLLCPGVLPAGVDLGPLVEAVCGSCAGPDVQLAQVLLDPADGPGRSLFASRGFREMAELIYLQLSVGGGARPPELPEGFAWHTYSAATRPLFERTVLETYQQSLDCPAMNGLRRIEDVIAGHQASGEFDPRYWFALTERDEPRGVVLLSRVPRTETAELVYLGLVPAARRRGISDLVLRQAQWAVRQMNLLRLTLAVDAHNTPAIRLYYRHGMRRVGSKIALMRDLRDTGREPQK